MLTPSARNGGFDVFGTRIDAVQTQAVIACMGEWVSQFRSETGSERKTGPVPARVVTLTNVHAVVESRRNPLLRIAFSNADIVCPDGMPLVWMGRRCGHPLPSRVSGPDLMVAFCEQTQEKEPSHYFLGAGPGVAAQLAANLKMRFPRLSVAGFCSPPFRGLTCEEDDALIARINAARPEVLWVGLGCPKQEVWIEQHRHRLNVGVILGVGQAFDIHAGILKRAPRWMRDAGLEWFFRLCAEPRRLWKRYLVTNSCFIWFLFASRTVAFMQRYRKPSDGTLPPAQA